MASKQQKWLDLSAYNAKLTPIRLPSGAQVVMLGGALTNSQIEQLKNDLHYRPIAAARNAPALFTPAHTDPKTHKITGVDFNRYLKLFPKAAVTEQSLDDITALWAGYSETDINQLWLDIKSHRAQRLVNADVEKVGLNRKGEPVYRNGATRFIYSNNDLIVQRSKSSNPRFMQYSTHRQDDMLAAAQGFLHETMEGDYVDEKRIEKLLADMDNPVHPLSKEGMAATKHIVGLIRGLVIQDYNAAYDKADIDVERLRMLSEQFATLPHATRYGKQHGSFNPVVGPDFSYIARRFFEVSDNIKDLTLVNESSIGALSFIPNQYPIHLVGDTSNKLHQLLENQTAALQSTSVDLTRSTPLKGRHVIAVTNGGNLPSESTINGVRVTRRDHLEAMNILSAVGDDTQLLLAVEGDDPLRTGEVLDGSKALHEYIFANYHCHALAEMGGELIGSRTAAATKRIYAITGRRPIATTAPAPLTLEVIDTPEQSYAFATTLAEKAVDHGLTELSKSELQETTSISDLIAAHQSAVRQSSKFQINEFQHRYVPITNLVEPTNGTIPRAMLTAQREVAKKIMRDVGNPDQFFMSEMGLPIEHIEEAFDAEQIDAITQAIWRQKNGKSMTLGDTTGKGKGRVLAALLYWSIKNDQIPVFLTARNGLLTDIWRDVCETKLDNYFRPMFITSEDVKAYGSSDVLFDQKQQAQTVGKHFDAPRFDLAEVRKDCNVVFSTYSQINSLADTYKKRSYVVA
ncbi:hypothetical protein [Aliagarivorans taiwanensis]|uniref:hypothetical protein n=1 Tax=Aliagarivorans taiwanensis TaxID=561966 RepID=UPI00041A9C02|nr:hypothetical protein [Aliagarivorans taiwanensis]